MKALELGVVGRITCAMKYFHKLFSRQFSVVTCDSAEAFLSMQGYVWNTQADMWTALIGGYCSANGKTSNCETQGL